MLGYGLLVCSSESVVVPGNNTSCPMRYEQDPVAFHIMDVSSELLRNVLRRCTSCISRERRPTCAYSVDRKVSNVWLKGRALARPSDQSERFEPFVRTMFHFLLSRYS